jgi:hypothetical protein
VVVILEQYYIYKINKDLVINNKVFFKYLLISCVIFYSIVKIMMPRIHEYNMSSLLELIIYVFIEIIVCIFFYCLVLLLFKDNFFFYILADIKTGIKRIYHGL